MAVEAREEGQLEQLTSERAARVVGLTYSSLFKGRRSSSSELVETSKRAKRVGGAQARNAPSERSYKCMAVGPLSLVVYYTVANRLSGVL